jgi:hypothetical protein
MRTESTGRQSYSYITFLHVRGIGWGARTVSSHTWRRSAAPILLAESDTALVPVPHTIRGSPLSMSGRLCLEAAQTGHLYRGCCNTTRPGLSCLILVAIRSSLARALAVQGGQVVLGLDCGCRGGEDAEDMR